MDSEGARGHEGDAENPALPQMARRGPRGDAEDRDVLERTTSTGSSSRRHSATFAVSSFARSPVEQLSHVLAADEEAQSRALQSRGIEDKEFVARLRRSCTLCQRAALLYPRNSELAVSFNGGKDACVVLYLWLASLAASAGRCQDEQARQGAAEQAAHGSSGADSARGQTVIFFDSPQEFPEVRSFVSWVVRSLGLHEVKVESSSFKRGMSDLVDDGLKAVVMGQRRGDPWTEKVDVFSPSDQGWPAFMRVNPILEWSFSDVWLFLRAFDLPYCILYDQGYTSVGTVENTVKNPALLRPDGSYAPAHELADGSLERSGRGAAAPEASSSSSSARQAQNAEQLDAAQDAQRSPALRAFKSSLSITPPRSAGLIVIGNEILSGKVLDVNAHHACAELRLRGVFVKSTEVVPDDVDAIARSVSRMAARCDFVFTSGGLGPTHDDVSMAGIARAFDAELVPDESFRAMLEKHFAASGAGSAATSDLETRSLERQVSAEVGREAACSKMVSLPSGARVEWPSDDNPWPLVSMRNVYIFAGNPSTFRKMFQRAARDGRFEGPQPKRPLSHLLWLDAGEEDVLCELQRTVDAFPFVEIGSYPSTDSDPGRRRLCVSLDTFDAQDLQAARLSLVSALPAGLLVDEEGAAGCGPPSTLPPAAAA